MRWVVVAVTALLVGLLVYGVASEGTDSSIDSALAEGRTPDAPDAELPTLGAETTGRLADYEGQVVLVNFWASWCEPCKDELPFLQDLQTDIEDAGGTVVGINSRDSSEDALQEVQAFGLTFPSLRDGSGDYAEEWGANRLPETFLLDREGRITALRRGTVDEAWVQEHVMPLLDS